jgi:hypothetical protein
MKDPVNLNRNKTVALLALFVCAMTVLWSSSSYAHTDPPYRTGSGSSPSTTQAAERSSIKFHGRTAAALLAPPVVRVEAPQASHETSDTVPIVLASTALLVALGGVGIVLLVRGRTHSAPQSSPPQTSA